MKDRAASIVRKALAWFAEHARALPWRGISDPYGVWVSEIMLQQTQVKTVIPYYERWMKRFPTVGALANAREEEVLKAWEGLGYYSRARNLQRAALIIQSERGGRFPETVDKWRMLPGIGPYTAGAIASIAYNLPAPAVDGNVIRVLARIDAISKRGAALARSVTRRAEQLAVEAAALAKEGAPAHAHACRDLTEGLMELGATVCTPLNPRCGQCPLRSECRALARGEPTRFPKLPRRQAIKRREFTALLIIAEGQALVRQRVVKPNAGFWELPNIEGALTIGEPFCTIQHSITTSRIKLAVRLLRASRRRALAEIRAEEQLLKGSEEWQPIEALATLPFTGAHRKVITLWEKSGLSK